jgi:hypothetical protein
MKSCQIFLTAFSDLQSGRCFVLDDNINLETHIDELY